MSIALRYTDKDEKKFTFPISPKFSRFLEEVHKLKIVQKLGEGTVKTGLKAFNLGNPEYPNIVVLLISVNSCGDSPVFIEYMDDLRRLQRENKIPKEDMVAVYKSITSPYSWIDNPQYCGKHTPATKSWTVFVLEPVEQLMIEKLFSYRERSRIEKLGLVANMYQQLFIMYKNLYAYGYKYADVNTDNIGMIGDKLIMIDISLVKVREPEDDDDFAELIDDDVFGNVLFFSEVSATKQKKFEDLMKIGRWKDLGHVNFIVSEEEDVFINNEIKRLIDLSISADTPYMIYDIFKIIY